MRKSKVKKADAKTGPEIVTLPKIYPKADDPSEPKIEPEVVTLLGALVVGTEIKPTGCSIRVSVLEKNGINMEDLRNRGLVK